MKTAYAVLGLGLFSCASIGFNYKWYGIDPLAGKLLAPTESGDLSLTLCQGDEVQKGKCAVMFIEEFDRMRSDYVQLKARLKACEEK